VERALPAAAAAAAAEEEEEPGQQRCASPLPVRLRLQGSRRQEWKWGRRCGEEQRGGLGLVVRGRRIVLVCPHYCSGGGGGGRGGQRVGGVGATAIRKPAGRVGQKWPGDETSRNSQKSVLWYIYWVSHYVQEHYGEVRLPPTNTQTKNEEHCQLAKHAQVVLVEILESQCIVNLQHKCNR